jgi:hypothetical protein
VEGADVGVIQRCDGARFALEALAEFFFGDFHGNQAVEARIAGSVYLPHAAGAQDAFDQIGAEVCAGSHYRIIMQQCPCCVPGGLPLDVTATAVTVAAP